MSLPWMIDSPNRLPNPSSACAVAASVSFSLTGSTFSEIDNTVWNNVLNSVVTDEAWMTSLVEIRCGVGFLGVVNDTYLLPNTVVAWMLASTFFGISLMYFGSTSSVNFAFDSPSTLTSSILPTLPISTPL